MISYISYTDTHKDTLISHLFITQWMLLPREQFSSLATEREKGWNKMTRSSSEAKFSFNRELHLVVKSASLTALKHEVLNPPRQNSTGTSQPSWWLPTCCSTTTTFNWGKQNGDINVLSLSAWFWQFLASRFQAPHKFWKKMAAKSKSYQHCHSITHGVALPLKTVVALHHYEDKLSDLGGSALEVMQDLNLTKRYTERRKQPVVQMSRTTATVWEKEKKKSIIFAVFLKTPSYLLVINLHRS